MTGSRCAGTRIDHRPSTQPYHGPLEYARPAVGGRHPAEWHEHARSGHACLEDHAHAATHRKQRRPAPHRAERSDTDRSLPPPHAVESPHTPGPIQAGRGNASPRPPQTLATPKELQADRICILPPPDRPSLLWLPTCITGLVDRHPIDDPNASPAHLFQPSTPSSRIDTHTHPVSLS